MGTAEKVGFHCLILVIRYKLCQKEDISIENKGYIWKIWRENLKIKKITQQMKITNGVKKKT